MGKKEQNKNNALIDQERTRGAEEHKTAMSYLQPERMKEKEWSDTNREDIMSGYKKFAAGDFGGAGGGAGGGGGAVAAHFNPALYGTPESMKLSGTLEDAKGRYKSFADTGGYTDADKFNIRDRGNAPIPAMFEGLNRRMQQGRSAGQASNIGFGASMERMAREQSRAAADASRNTELGIMDRVNTGKKWGLEGYTGIGNTETDLEAQNVMGRNSVNQRNVDIGNEYGMANAQSAAAAASSNNASSAANDRWRAGMQMDALNAQQGLWEANPGELSRYDDLLLRERDMASGQNQSSNMQRQAYNPNFSYMDKIGQGVNIAGGAMGAVTGLGGLTKPKNYLGGRTVRPGTEDA